jgi:hypothetical protein
VWVFRSRSRSRSVATIPLTGDQVRGRLAWKDNQRLAFDKSVRIGFVLRQAWLYSFWLEPG